MILMDRNKGTISINFDTFWNRRRISTIRTSTLRLPRLGLSLDCGFLCVCGKFESVEMYTMHMYITLQIPSCTQQRLIPMNILFFQLPPVVSAFDCHLYLHCLHSFFIAHNATLIQRQISVLNKNFWNFWNS